MCVFIILHISSTSGNFPSSCSFIVAHPKNSLSECPIYIFPCFLISESVLYSRITNEPMNTTNAMAIAIPETSIVVYSLFLDKNLK